MVAIIIAAHGESAPALLGSTTMIVGDVDNVHAVTFVPGQGPDDLLEAYGNAIGDSDDDVLILVDLFGGSPYNAGARFVAEREGSDVVSGVNIPMLVEVFTAARRPNHHRQTCRKSPQSRQHRSTGLQGRKTCETRADLYPTECRSGKHGVDKRGNRDRPQFPPRPQRHHEGGGTAHRFPPHPRASRRSMGQLRGTANTHRCL